MAEQDTRVDGNATPEVVAYHLLLRILEVEARPAVGGTTPAGKISRNVILDAYSDCLEAVHGKRPRKGGAVSS